jgi:hypothetical protein
MVDLPPDFLEGFGGINELYAVMASAAQREIRGPVAAV